VCQSLSFQVKNLEEEENLFVSRWKNEICSGEARTPSQTLDPGKKHEALNP
jgi:hypothetical protein